MVPGAGFARKTEHIVIFTARIYHTTAYEAKQKGSWRKVSGKPGVSAQGSPPGSVRQSGLRSPAETVTTCVPCQEVH